jgi:hypothetical protein
MRTPSQRRNDADSSATAAERGRAPGTVELDKIAGAGSPNSGGTGSGGGAGGTAN